MEQQQIIPEEAAQSQSNHASQQLKEELPEQPSEQASEQTSEQFSEPTSEQAGEQTQTDAQSPPPLSKKKRLWAWLAGIVLLIAAVLLCYRYLNGGETAIVIASCPSSRCVKLYDIKRGSLMQEYPVDFSPGCAQLNPDATQMAVVNRENNEIAIYSLPEGHQLGKFTTVSHAGNIDYNVSQPGYIIAQGESGQVKYNLKQCLGSKAPCPGESEDHADIQVEDIRTEFPANPENNEDAELNILIQPGLTEAIAAKGSGKPLGTIPLGEEPLDPIWNLARTKCTVVVRGNNEAAIIDPDSLQVVKRVPLPPVPNHMQRPYNLDLAVTFCDDSRCAVIFNLNRSSIARTIDLKEGQVEIKVWPIEPNTSSDGPAPAGPPQGPPPAPPAPAK